MAELLLELFSEEIPARMQARAAADLQRLVTDKLKEAGLSWDKVAAFATPRRLTLVVDGLPTETPDTVEERKGPRADAPEKAIEGFLKSVGMTRDQVEERDTGKGVVLFAVIKKQGRKTAELLQAIVPTVINSFPWPKSQKWGNDTVTWVRPLRNILCLFDARHIEISLSGGQLYASQQGDIKILPVISSIPSEAVTWGHRFLAPQPFTVKNFADYKAKLQKAYVILIADDRKAKIMADAMLLAADANLSLMEDSALLDEVAGLVEWPVALMGSFDPAFLDVPAEVLTATMRANQKYFSLVDPNTGKLAPHFIVIANMETADKGRAIVAGNERVLKARLSDAKFFWDQDLKVQLEDRVPALDGIVFHAKLGSVGDKVKRMVALAEYLAPLVGADAEQAKRAAHLAKADLVSGVVGEFPEVQGIMGRYYALRQGETEAVANAIADHYSPKGPDDKCPTNPVSIAVALADKIDTLVGFFGINEKPTGSKDPFALRRAALGVLRIINENGLRLSLAQVMTWAAKKYGSLIADFAPGDLIDFFSDRLKVYLKDQNIRHDYVSAVFALGGEDDMLRLKSRAEALQQMLSTDDGANLLAAYRRGSNIVGIEEKKDKRAYTGGVDAAQLKLPEETALYQKLQDVQSKVAEAVKQERWIEAMTAVSALRAPIDAFFDKVTVNDADASLRENRLNLLAEFRATLGAVADFSKVEG